jgi:TonB-linked SusC/RagA family outer membrane protein
MYKFYPKIFVQPPGCIAKILLTMKITTLLLIAAILQVSASSLAQKITLSEKNSPLSKVFNQIRQQSGYDFLINKSVLNNAKPVNLEVKGVELKDVLEQIFTDQSFEYEITNKIILVKVKEKSFFNQLISEIVAADIRGHVVDPEGNPLVGATITAGDKTTTTNVNGDFFLTGVADDAVIKIIFIGYVTKQLKANANMSRIVMEVNLSKLDEIKVIAYGTTTQRLSTGDISTIKAADIEKQPVNNILDALIGRIAGLQITQTSGIPGAAPSVIIRGNGNINNQISTDPLYILDGVPVSATQALSNTGALDNRAFNLLTSLNTTDIESVSVLKDADATAIFGSRGANGVIIITTKKGKPGKMITNVKASMGFQKVGHFIDLLNTDQYVALRTEAFKNDGLTPNLTVGNTNYAPDLLLWDRNNITDWQKEFIGRTAVSNDLSFSMTGGSETSKYFISGANHKEGSVMPGDSKFIRNSFTASINNTSVNKKFNLQITTDYSMSNLNLLPSDLVNSIYMAPYAPMYNADGSINWPNYPLANTLRKYALPTKNFAGNALISYEFIPGLKLKATGGTNTTTVNMSLEQPKGSFDPASGTLASLTKQTVENNNWIVEPQLEYNHTFNKHHINALVGATYQKTTSTSNTQTGTGFPDDGLISNIASATTINTQSSYTPYAYSAIFGRLTYDYKREFLANVTFRRDGSSRFGDDDKFGNFGAIGLGWNSIVLT